MQTLTIAKSKSTPAVLLDKETGSFFIIGKSISEDAMGFYQPIIGWLELYLQSPNSITTIVFELEFFNSDSSKILIYLFKLLNKAFQAGYDIRVEWRYVADDTDTLEAGIDFSSLVQISFTFNALQIN